MRASVLLWRWQHANDMEMVAAIVRESFGAIDPATTCDGLSTRSFRCKRPFDIGMPGSLPRARLSAEPSPIYILEGVNSVQVQIVL